MTRNGVGDRTIVSGRVHFAQAHSEVELEAQMRWATALGFSPIAFFVIKVVWSLLLAQTLLDGPVLTAFGVVILATIIYLWWQFKKSAKTELDYIQCAIKAKSNS